MPFEGSQMADDENNGAGQSDVTRRDFIHVMSVSVGAVATGLESSPTPRTGRLPD